MVDEVEGRLLTRSLISFVPQMTNVVIDLIHLDRVVLQDRTERRNISSRVLAPSRGRTHLSKALPYFSKSLLATSPTYNSNHQLIVLIQTRMGKVLALVLMS